MAKPVTDEEHGRIVALLRDGKSQGETSRITGRHVSTVNRIAKAVGIKSNVAEPKKATEARKAYAEVRRLELIGKGFEKADELLAKLHDAGEFQKWTVGLGTLVDKARLETGEVTDRREQRSHNASRDLEDYFKDLDTYRAQHGEAGIKQPVDTTGTD